LTPSRHREHLDDASRGATNAAARRNRHRAGDHRSSDQSRQNGDQARRSVASRQTALRKSANVQRCDLDRLFVGVRENPRVGAVIDALPYRLVQRPMRPSGVPSTEADRSAVTLLMLSISW
jgi:hypothetical protein